MQNGDDDTPTARLEKCGVMKSDTVLWGYGMRKLCSRNQRLNREERIMHCTKPEYFGSKEQRDSGSLAVYVSQSDG